MASQYYKQLKLHWENNEKTKKKNYKFRKYSTFYNINEIDVGVLFNHIESLWQNKIWQGLISKLLKKRKLTKVIDMLEFPKWKLSLGKMTNLWMFLQKESSYEHVEKTKHEVN